MLKEFKFQDQVTITLETPDLVVQRSSGKTGVDAIEFLERTLQEIVAEHGKPRVLSIAAAGSEVTAEARKRIGQVEWPVKCWAAVTPELSFRALLNMVTRAQQLIGKIKYEAKMFGTEEEARAWIETFK